MTYHSEASSRPAAAGPPSRRRYASGGIRPMRPATGPQLWRLNEQGLLRLVDISDELFVPGGPAARLSAIVQGEATVLLDRLVRERWAGLERWPKAGEAWTVRDGLVIPLAAPDESES